MINFNYWWYYKEIVLNLLNINSTVIKKFNNKSLNEITELL